MTSHWALETPQTDPGSNPDLRLLVRGALPFTQPGWLAAWWTSFAPAYRPLPLSLFAGGRRIGFVPLMERDRQVVFHGDPEIFDYQDLACIPGEEGTVCGELLDYLDRTGMATLELAWLLPDSVALTTLAPLARERGYGVTVQEVGISVRCALPATWDGYLAHLDGKQRHEVRRKLHRLAASGTPTIRVVTKPDDADEAMDLFFDLFTRSRPDKAAFMSPAMTLYFRRLARETARLDLLRLFFLDLDGRAIATAMTFAHGETLYLYNNGYDPSAKALSPGLLVKVLSLRWAIEQGLAVYDFLRGGEAYKHHLGGHEVRLMTCRIELRPGGARR